MPSPSPFIVGQPLPPQYFVGHQRALDMILSRLRHPSRGSTSIVGSSYTGRSSLLRYLTSDLAKQRHPELQSCWTVLFEALLDQEDLDAQSFWWEIFQMVVDVCQGDTVQKALNKALTKAEQRKLSLPDIRKVVDSIGKTGHTLLLVIDDFDHLMTNTNLVPPNDKQFFERFRHLCQRTFHGLAMVVATPRSLQDHWKFPHGSIFYNIFTSALLGRLTNAEVDELLNRMLVDTGVTFTDEDRLEIRQRSENLPVYLQYYAGLMYEGHIVGKDQKERKETIRNELKKADNMHIQLTRHLIKRMTDPEKATFEKAVKAPGSLTNDEKKQLEALNARGGLPPGVKNL